MMTDEKAKTKSQESLSAMKNASKHLTEILKSVESQSMIMGTVATELNTIASKLGDVGVHIYTDSMSKYEWTSVKHLLQSIAAKLNSGRNV